MPDTVTHESLFTRGGSMSSRPIRSAAVGVLVGLALVGCAATTPPADGSGDAGGSDTGATSTDFVTVSGTGRYEVGVDIPYGGYQLHGEPAEQPAGCTWQILDADGGVSFENQGSYAFLTDVPEIVTFETDGCPDWEQFE